MRTASHNAAVKAAALLLFVLVVAACLFLVFGRSSSGKEPAASASATAWTCSMDPQFVLPEPGKCPKCFMDLIPLEEGAAGGGRRELVLKREASDLAGIHADIVERAPASETASDGETTGDIAADVPLTVPEAALLRNVGRTFVFSVADAGDMTSFTLREIEPGKRLGDRREVLSGLDEGELVAVSGLFRIDSAMQILGKVSLANLPPGDLADVDKPDIPPFQPAERSDLDLRHDNGLALDDWFRAYEEVRAALAKDDFAAATAPARRLREAMDTTGGSLPTEFTDLHAGLARDAGVMADATDLADRRAAFDRMSADMVLLARRYGTPGGGLNLVFCPMAFDGRGAHWLQPGQTVDNPYHGLEMPLCGWLVEKITPPGDK